MDESRNEPSRQKCGLGFFGHKDAPVEHCTATNPRAVFEFVIYAKTERASTETPAPQTLSLKKEIRAEGAGFVLYFSPAMRACEYSLEVWRLVSGSPG